MKNINLQQSILPGMVLFLLCDIGWPVKLFSQNISELLASGRLPKTVSVNNPGTQSYSMVTDYYNHDVLGNFFSKTRVTGIYTKGLEDGKVKWNRVTIADSYLKDAVFPSGTLQEYMEAFSYYPDKKMMYEESFSCFPAIQGIFCKNLVWDVMGFEGFAVHYSDSLILNEQYDAGAFNGKINLENLGTFENKDIKLTWTGISIMNTEPCAVIEFLALSNPMDFNSEMFQIKGRSHYWGTVWVSITHREIQKAVLYEDVNMDMKMAGQEKSNLYNSTREIIFSKITDPVNP